MIKEEWRDVIGYENVYQVSNTGKVKSLDRVVNYSNNGDRKFKGKILKPGIDKKGYEIVCLYKCGRKKTRYVHQLVSESFLSHSPCGMTLVVNHINFNKLDNRVGNLEIVTTRKNANHKHLKSSSVFTGVYWYKRDSNWRASIYLNGKQKNLGSFNSEKEASEAYKKELQIIENNK